MSSQTSSASTIRRLSTSASSRLTEGLLSSSGTVASVGLVTALLTFSFVVWFVIELHIQSSISAPLARSAVVMNSSINQSLATLRAWVAYGQDASRKERTRIWVEQIEPTLETLDSLSGRLGTASVTADLAELRALLSELKLVQWMIEDVSNTPGNPQ